MENRLTRQAKKAHRKEQKHERKEARFHARAVNQALRGNVCRASRLENRANVQHQRAQAARSRCDAANAKLAGVSSGGCKSGREQQHCSCCTHNTSQTVPFGVPATPDAGQPNPYPNEPPSAYTVTSTIYYPTGIVAPPPAGPPPAYPGPTCPVPPYTAPTVNAMKA